MFLLTLSCRYLAYLWCQANSKTEEAHAFLKNGLEANPTSFLLNFAFSEYHEQALMTLQGAANADPKKVEEKKTEGHELFKNFIGLLKKELDEIEAHHISEGGTHVSQQPSGTNQVPVVSNAITVEDDDVTMKENEIYGIIDTAAAEAKEREKERLRENEKREALLINKRVELGQVSIAWMRYAKRVGQSVGLRNVFKEVRADKWVCWQVFECAGEFRSGFFKFIGCQF